MHRSSNRNRPSQYDDRARNGGRVDGRSADDRDGNYGAVGQRPGVERGRDTSRGPDRNFGPEPGAHDGRYDPADGIRMERGYEPDRDDSYQYREQGFDDLRRPIARDAEPARPHHRFVSDPGYGARGPHNAWDAPPPNGRTGRDALDRPTTIGKGPKGYTRSDERIR
jgi:hypothetical protein